LLRDALAGRRKVLEPDHLHTLRSVHDLCLLLVDRGRLKEAEALALEYEHGIPCALSPKHPDNVIAQTNLGLIWRLRGEPGKAATYYGKAAEAAERILGPDHPRTLAARSELARVQAEAKRAGTPKASDGTDP
jgi:hypothetical protein